MLFSLTRYVLCWQPQRCWPYLSTGFVDAYSKVAFAKLHITKTPITAADILNDKFLPYFKQPGLLMLRVLTDRSLAYCVKVEHHDYQLYLAINDNEHTKTKAMSPQTNGKLIWAEKNLAQI